MKYHSLNYYDYCIYYGKKTIEILEGKTVLIVGKLKKNTNTTLLGLISHKYDVEKG